MASESLTFDIFANDRASETFRRLGQSAGDTSDRVRGLGDRLDKLGNRVARARVELQGGKEAQAAMDRLDVKLIELGRRTSNPNIDVKGVARAQADISAIDLALDNLGKKTARPSVKETFAGLAGPGFLGPALLALPAVTTMLGVATGAAIGLGGAFTAAGIAVGGYGLVAKSVLSASSTAASAVEKAQQNYNIALANGTKHATAYKAEQVAIAKAYAGLSPAQIRLSQQLGDIADKWDHFKAAVTPLIAGSLQPWLHGVGVAIGDLKRLLTPMGPVVHDLGVQFGILMGSSTFKDFMKWSGQTGGAVTKSVGGAVLDLITAMTFLLPKFTPLIDGAAKGLTKWGDAFVRWSASQKAANEITAFLGWFHTNGPMVRTLLVNLGGALKALAPGLGAASTLELKTLSSFLAFVARLPPNIAKPLVLLAGAMLTLSKMGIITVGVRLAALPGAGPLAGAAAIGVGIAMKIHEDVKKGIKALIPDIGQWLTGAMGMISLAASGWADAIIKHFPRPVMRMFDTVRAYIGWALGQIGIFAMRTVVHILDAFSAIPIIGSRFRSARNAAKAELDKLEGDSRRVWNGIQAGLDNLHGTRVNLQAQVVFPAGSGYSQLKHKYPGFAAGTGGAAPGLAWVGERGPELVAFHGGEQVYSHQQSRKIGGYASGTPSPHFTGQWPTQIHGAMSALQSMVYSIASDVKSLIGPVRMTAPTPRFGAGGPGGGAPGANAALAQRLYSALMKPGDWAAWNYVAMRESGWNQFATNPSSGAYGIPQALPPTKMPFAAQRAGGSNPMAQIGWMWNYMASSYGGPQGAAAHEQAYNWYDRGGWLPRGVSVAVNRTGRPERVLAPGEGTHVVLEVRSGGSRLDDALVEIIRHAVKVRGGGNVQVALGRRGA